MTDAAPPPPPPPAPQTPASILVVEDDASIRELLYLVLADLGHDVRVVSNAEDALLRVAEQRPDLLVLDLGLPLRDGDELLSLLQRGIGTPQRLLIVSARPEDDVRRVAREYGAGWLTKPFDPDDLELEVAAALGPAPGGPAMDEARLTALLAALRRMDAEPPATGQ